MAEVLEIEKIETEQNQELPKPEKDTWIFKLPAEVCQREGFAEGTMISLTVKTAGFKQQLSIKRLKQKNLRNDLLKNTAIL